MSDWDIKITGPNNAQAHMVSTDANEKTLVAEFRKLLRNTKQASKEIPFHGPTLEQARKSPVKDR